MINFSSIGRVALAGVVACGAVALPGACGSAAKVPYAEQFERGRTQDRVVDVHVFVGETDLVMTNTTAEDFEGGKVWLNAQYSRPFERFDIGETLRFDLRSFRNEFSEPFRAGGFFAVERPDTVVQVQLETEGELIGLVVIDKTEN